MHSKRAHIQSNRPHAAYPNACERLALLFGDQLDIDSPMLASLDPARDVILMMEVAEESRHVASHVQRTVLFLSAMRHLAAQLRTKGFRVEYVRLTDPENTGSFRGEIVRAASRIQPRALTFIRPGEWRVLHIVEQCAAQLNLPMEMHEDDHFFTAPDEFARWARGRSSLTMEFFYREQRRRTGYLMNGRGKTAAPEGGTWNFDSQNRVSFGAAGPKKPVPKLARFSPDNITRETIADVRARLPDLPGNAVGAESFHWPVTRADALRSLADFVEHRLPLFGPYEDAMWSTEPTLYHSVLSPLLNLKLLNPRECCKAAIAAFRNGHASLQSVEAFVRQIIGWREFIRGIYWLEGPEYQSRNALDQHGRLPEFYWTGKTDMACMRHCLSQVIDSAYGHHIQRLIVTGNFALISGVHPKAISDWYLGMFADGVDWVTLPNTLGMVMHADRRQSAPAGSTGLVGTKPYAASGKYIQRMSNYCTSCRFDPGKREGPDACPFTVFYWDFLIRNRDRFAANTRMKLMLGQVDKMSPQSRVQITISASRLRTQLGIEPISALPPVSTR